jgi:hypothetical protein
MAARPLNRCCELLPIVVAHHVEGQLAAELLEVRRQDRPSEGLRPLRRRELERDRDSRQHATNK